MNVYEKLSKARIELQSKKLKKSGKNKHLGFEYMELMDFLPTINKINDENKIISLFTTDAEGVKLTIVDIDKPDDKIVFTSTSAKAKLSGTTSPVQELGAEHTYMRRYMYMEAYEITEKDVVDGMLGDTTPNAQKPTKNELKPAQDTNGPCSQKQLDLITKLAMKKSVDLATLPKKHGAESLMTLTISQASKIIDDLQK